jgi:hypothetical protein
MIRAAVRVIVVDLYGTLVRSDGAGLAAALSRRSVSELLVLLDGKRGRRQDRFRPSPRG